MGPSAPDSWNLYDTPMTSRLWMGSSHFPNWNVFASACELAKPGFITLSLRRQTATGGQSYWKLIRSLDIPILPNTAGCFSAHEAIQLAEISRDTFETDWIKVEVIADEQSLHPEGPELIRACEVLIQKGFKVLPYCSDDLSICKALTDVGCRALMPLGAPIGTGLGLLNPFNLERLRYRFPKIPLILDAGLGKPSQATQVMEMGFDAVLLNTAISQSVNPAEMALAFLEAVSAGHRAFKAVPMPAQPNAQPSTPSMDMPIGDYRVGAELYGN